MITKKRRFRPGTIMKNWFRKRGSTPSSSSSSPQDEEKQGVENQIMGGDNDDTSTIKALTDEQVDDCKEAFSVFVDKQGLVDVEQLGPMMRALGDKITEDELERLTDEYDHKHFERGGKMDFYSFMELMKPRIIEKNDVYNNVSIDKLFTEFDVDGDGYISAQELRQSLQKLGDKFKDVAEELTDEDVEEIMIESDLDGDGQISYSEFVVMIPRLNQIIEE